jgi:hypothetical protein
MGKIVDPAIIKYWLSITDRVKQASDFRLPPAGAPITDYQLWQTIGSLPISVNHVTSTIMWYRWGEAVARAFDLILHEKVPVEISQSIKLISSKTIGFYVFIYVL